MRAVDDYRECYAERPSQIALEGARVAEEEYCRGPPPLQGDS